MFTFHFDSCQDICPARERSGNITPPPSSIHHIYSCVTSSSVTWHHLGRHDEGDPGDDDEEARGEVDLQQHSTVQYSAVQHCTGGEIDLQQHRGPPPHQLNL